MGGWVGPTAGVEVLEKRKISCPHRDLNSGPFIWNYCYYEDTIFI
jgi:hypothetical protein